MAGEGSIAGMITSLSNNKKLLRKQSMFKPQRTFISIKNQYIKNGDGDFNFKTATKEQLTEIRLKIRKQERRRNLISIGISITVISFFVFLSFKLFRDVNTVADNTAEIELKQKTDKSLYLIEDGDNWLKQRKWSNAIFQYKKALEIFPNDFSVNYRLTYAYSLRCEYTMEGCEEGRLMLNKLLKQFPENSDLLVLKKKLEFENY